MKRQARKRGRPNEPDPETNGLSEYEIARLKRIKENEAILREFGIDGSLTHSSRGKRTLKASSDRASGPKARASSSQNLKQVLRRTATATSRRTSAHWSGQTLTIAQGCGDDDGEQGGAEDDARKNVAELASSRTNLTASTIAQGAVTMGS